jgi:hypothetical protein
VTALVDLVEVDEVVISTLSPAAWRTIDLARKDRHGSRNGDVHHYLGPRFTPQMLEAWEEAFEMISAEMLKGADMLPSREEGDFR